MGSYCSKSSTFTHLGRKKNMLLLLHLFLPLIALSASVSLLSLFYLIIFELYCKKIISAALGFLFTG